MLRVALAMHVEQPEVDERREHARDASPPRPDSGRRRSRARCGTGRVCRPPGTGPRRRRTRRRSPPRSRARGRRPGRSRWPCVRPRASRRRRRRRRPPRPRAPAERRTRPPPRAARRAGAAPPDSRRRVTDPAPADRSPAAAGSSRASSSDATRGGTARPMTVASGATYRSLIARYRASERSSKDRTAETSLRTPRIRSGTSSVVPSTHARVARPWNGTWTTDPIPAPSSSGRS